MEPLLLSQKWAIVINNKEPLYGYFVSFIVNADKKTYPYDANYHFAFCPDEKMTEFQKGKIEQFKEFPSYIELLNLSDIKALSLVVSP